MTLGITSKAIMLDFWAQVVITLCIAIIFSELIHAERQVRPLIALAVMRAGQHQHLQRHCQHLRSQKQRQGPPFFHCKTQLLWKNTGTVLLPDHPHSELGSFVPVCASPPRHPQSRPRRWYQIKTTCSWSMSRSGLPHDENVNNAHPPSLLEIIHWQQKS